MSQDLETLRDKALYVAPANPAGRALQGRLSDAGARVLGLADNLKQGSDIINHANQAQPYDAIVVAKGPFQNAICQGLLARGFSANSIYCQQENDSQIKPFRMTIGIRIQQLRNQLVSFAIRAGCALLPKGKAIYYAEEFIDTNVLLAWCEHTHTYPDEALLVAMSLKRQPLDALPGKVFSAEVVNVLPVLAEGELEADGRMISITQAKSMPGHVPVQMKITDPRFAAYAQHVPGGSYGQSAIYSEHFSHVAIMRKVILRMSSWMSYFFPFH